MDNSGLPNGFITTEEAIKLIGTNTFDVPTVDIKWLAWHIDWVEELHNFNIPRVRLITKEEAERFMKDHPGKRPNELVSEGPVYVYVRTSYDKEALRKAIKDNFRETSGREFNAPITRGISTVKDEETGNSERPRVTKKTIAKEGDIIGTGASATTNSADGAGI